MTTTTNGVNSTQEVPTPFNTTSTWKKEGNKLTFVVNGQEQVATILELTDTAFRYELELVVDVNEGVYSTSSKTKSLVVFKR
ncbi:MAG: lipocalin family protein [Flavobacteriales bacterium]|nr:lipocalin family protein [Flavobacteriales bacterium]